MINLPVLLNCISALGAFVAAIFWYFSATASVPPNNQPDSDGWIQGGIEVDGKDFIASALAQQNWSRRGAYAAALAALCQGIAMGLAAVTAA